MGEYKAASTVLRALARVQGDQLRLASLDSGANKEARGRGARSCARTIKQMRNAVMTLTAQDPSLWDDHKDPSKSMPDDSGARMVWSFAIACRDHWLLCNDDDMPSRRVAVILERQRNIAVTADIGAVEAVSNAMADVFDDMRYMKVDQPAKPRRLGKRRTIRLVTQ